MVSVWQRAALIAALVVGASCKSDPTGLMVVVDLEPMLRQMMGGRSVTLDVAVTYRGKSAPEIRRSVVTRWPATIAIQSDQWRDEVLIEVSMPIGAPMDSDAGMMAGENVIVGRAIATYAAEKVLTVPIILWGACNVPMAPPVGTTNDCRYPRLTTQPVLAQAAINAASGALRQFGRDPALVQTCAFDRSCMSAIVATLEYQPALAAACDGGVRRLASCEGMMPPPDAGPMSVDATTDTPAAADHPDAPTDTPAADDHPDAPIDTPEPVDGGLLPDVVPDVVPGVVPDVVPSLG